MMTKRSVPVTVTVKDNACCDLERRPHRWQRSSTCWCGSTPSVRSLLHFLLGVCCLAAFATSFTTPTSSSSFSFSSIKKSTRLLASTLDKKAKKVTATATTNKKESARLVKAKLLLEQFQSDTVTVEDVITISAVNPSQASNGNSNSNMLVPDNYWSNGHLEDNQVRRNGQKAYVTRWARGVKVAEPLTKYDPVQAEQILFRQPAKWLLRNFQIAFPMGWWAAGVVTDYWMGKSRENRRQRAQQLTRAISNLGPAIIKGGQALASRPDLLPSEYLQELQKLQDDVPRFSNALAFRTVEQELGIDNFSEVFELVESEPIAAASIGQGTVQC